MKTLYRALYQVVTDTDPVEPSLQQRNYAPTSSEQGLLDYALLQELTETGCHSNYITTLVACFKQEGDQLLHGLRQAFDLKIITGSRSILHRLKGMCGSIGAREMAAICHESLTLSDTELCASAKRITTALFQLHKESAKQLDTFSEYSISSNPVRMQSSPDFAKTGISPVSQPGA
jgi:HPt (histidine-containing phosphotransfer) domain-containing protein